jgi:hypothetical protein
MILKKPAQSATKYGAGEADLPFPAGITSPPARGPGGGIEGPLARSLSGGRR